MKKRILALLLSAVMVLSIAGCGGTPAPSGGAPAAAKSVVKVQWIGSFKAEDSTNPISGEMNKGLHVLETEFEKTNPNIDIQFLLMGWDDYQKKTQAMLIAGEADVYQAPGIASIANQGLLEPLQPYIDKDKYNLDIYIDGQIDGWKVVGANDKEPQIYGLPMIGDTRFIAYDKRIFDHYGVPYLSESPTPDDIMSAATKMTGTDPVTGTKTYGIFHKGTDASDTVINLNEYYGGTWGEGNRPNELKVNFNTPTMQKALETLIAFNKFAPDGVMANQGGELFESSGNNIAINLRSNPAVLNNLQAQGLNDNYGVSRLFINKEEGMGGMFAGSPVVIASNSKVKDASWEWLKFTGSEFFMNYFWENQRNEGLPVLKSAMKLESIASNENYKAVLDSMAYLWTPRYAYRASQPKQALVAAVEDAALNGKPIPEALANAQKESDEWIAAQ